MTVKLAFRSDDILAVAFSVSECSSCHWDSVKNRFIAQIFGSDWVQV